MLFSFSSSPLQLPRGSLPNEVWNSLKSYKKVMAVINCFQFHCVLYCWCISTWIPQSWKLNISLCWAICCLHSIRARNQGVHRGEQHKWIKLGEKMGKFSLEEGLKGASTVICIWTTERKRILYIQQLVKKVSQGKNT